MVTVDMTGFNCMIGTGFNSMIGLIAVCLCTSRAVELMILILTKHYPVLF